MPRCSFSSSPGEAPVQGFLWCQADELVEDRRPGMVDGRLPLLVLCSQADLAAAIGMDVVLVRRQG